MTRSVRFVIFGLGTVGTCVLVLLAVFGLPHFGSSFHPYRNAAVDAATSHATSNVVSSVNFDLRGLDTFGEESILLASVLAAVVLLRPGEDESEERDLSSGRVLDSTRLIGWAMTPVAVIIGLDLVTHGHVTPGGGFQGGVVLGTAIHLVYVAGSYRLLSRVRPLRPFEWSDAIAAGAFACLGLAGIIAAGSFLANFVAQGTFGTLFSGGTVPMLNGAVGIEVASGVIVLISRFLEQARMVGGGDEAKGESR